MTGADSSSCGQRSGLGLDDPAGATANGARPRIYTCHGAASQNWTLPGGGSLTPPPPTSPTGPISSGLNGTAAQSVTVGTDSTLEILGSCLDVTGNHTANGTLIEVWGCNGGANEKWTLTNGTLVSAASGRCLDDPGFATANGTQLDIWDCNDGRGGASQPRPAHLPWKSQQEPL